MVSGEKPLENIYPKRYKKVRGEEQEKWMNICVIIIENAITEWRALEYGQCLSKRINSQMIYAIELEDFFNSRFFESLLEYVLPDLPPDDVRKELRITKEDQNARQASLSTAQKNVEKRYVATFPDFVHKARRNREGEQKTEEDHQQSPGGKRAAEDRH